MDSTGHQLSLFGDDPENALAFVQSLDELAREIRRCNRCPLAEERIRAVPGEGPEDAPVVFIGEGPGADEDRTGRPFVGRAGRYFDEVLAKVGIPRSGIYITNVVKCRPPGNRVPRPEEAAACLPFLWRQIELIRPKVLVLLGGVAARYVLKDGRGVGELRGTWHGPLKEAYVLVTYHPAGVLRDRRKEEEFLADMALVARAYRKLMRQRSQNSRPKEFGKGV
ncbi:uracil-DNA glycosylase [Brockia lithotrophica]|uniref:Type-4 uracil-DNA glycosylase n=1 Tax=Brockia lithotrophica TaxID=933949 RepID=A0A660L6I3_9BACL|nr:uracil-DNA glycosylase [Brockia lithotrophica]RKQ88834.1 DNA polymerase [Brockia lithotrophica]